MVVAGELYGWGRALLAAVIFLAIVALSLRKLKRVTSVPPEPDLADVRAYDLRYVCSVCGLALKVEVAARDKPPTHCGEAMEMVTEGGRAPLRPI